MAKPWAILMAAGGVVLVILSMVIAGYPEHSKWFPIFLIGGGLLGWFGVTKYRAA
jgi:hypothetical protein